MRVAGSIPASPTSDVKREFDADGVIALGENGKGLSYEEPTEGGDAYADQIVCAGDGDDG